MRGRPSTTTKRQHGGTTPRKSATNARHPPPLHGKAHGVKALAQLLSFAALLCGPAALSACSAFQTNLQDTQVDYLETARQNFDKGEEKMADESWNEAIKYFDYVKNKYPYSKYAVLAELRTADAHFAREKWLEAADAYRIFVRFHPRHEKVPYATYRVALAYSKEIDQDVWWFPTAIEKDQSAAKDAVRAFDEYLARFPDGENVKEARELRAQARSRLAETDLYAAGFYEDREKWQGAVWRYERVAKEYPDTPKAAFALLRAARITDDRLGEPDVATAFYQRVVAEHPQSPEAEDAKAALVSRPPPQPAKPTPAPVPLPAHPLPDPRRDPPDAPEGGPADAPPGG
jgi:outer membrane protein assembly factor BamD